MLSAERRFAALPRGASAVGGLFADFLAVLFANLFAILRFVALLMRGTIPCLYQLFVGARHASPLHFSAPPGGLLCERSSISVASGRDRIQCAMQMQRPSPSW